MNESCNELIEHYLFNLRFMFIN